MITHVAVLLAPTSQPYMMRDIFPYSQNGFYVFCQESCLWTTGEKKRPLQEKKKKKKYEADWMMNIHSEEFLMDHSAVWCYYGVII